MHKFRRLMEEDRMWPERREENQNIVILRNIWEKISSTKEVSKLRCCKGERGLK